MSVPPKRAGGPLGPRALVALGVGLLSLFVLVAIASRTDTPLRSRSSERGEVPAFLSDYTATFFLVFVLPVGMLLLVYAYAVRMKVRPTKGRSHGRGFRRTILLVGAVSLAAVLVAQWLAERRGDDDRNQAASVLRDDDRSRGSALRPATFRWELAVVLYALLGAAVLAAVAAGRRRGSPASPEDELAERLTDVLDETLDDLRAEADPRRAVISAYARMERALAAYGLPRRSFEAPLEYLSRILLELRVRAAAAFDLTELFERAKFSTHAIDASMKDEAIAALVAVRDDLRAPP